jgi:hypothetical protein
MSKRAARLKKNQVAIEINDLARLAFHARTASWNLKSESDRRWLKHSLGKAWKIIASWRSA